MSDNPIGEVIESAATSFVAQCLEVPRQIVSRLYDPPALGSFVRIGGGASRSTGSEEQPVPRPEPPADDEPDPFLDGPPAPILGSREGKETLLPAATYALVCGASTTSLEAGRRPSALGFADEDELRSQQPQIFELLRTEFTGLLLAHSTESGTLKRHLPPRPPRVHSRVYPCADAEVRALCADWGFLRGLLSPSGGLTLSVPPDELVAACLRGGREACERDGGDGRDFLLSAGRALASLLAEDYERLQAILRNVL